MSHNNTKKPTGNLPTTLAYRYNCFLPAYLGAQSFALPGLLAALAYSTLLGTPLGKQIFVDTLLP